MKRLVRIDHIRCGDWGEGATYILAPADWDEGEIDRRANEAQKSYLKDFAAAQKLPGKPRQPGYQPDFKSCDQSKTVAEVFAEHEAVKAAYDDWKSKERVVSRKFEDYLVEQGFTEIWESDLSVCVDWGHAHGQAYDYGSDDVLSYKLPSPLELARIKRTDNDDD